MVKEFLNEGLGVILAGVVREVLEGVLIGGFFCFPSRNDLLEFFGGVKSSAGIPF